MHRTTSRIVLAAIGVLLALGPASAADKSWPRELKTEKGVLTIYQPQPEKFENNILTGRAAASLVPKGQTTPVFGVFWFTGRVDTDRDKGTAVLRDIAVTNTRWPESTEPNEKDISAFLTALMPKTGVPISLERLKASLATAELEQKSIAGLKHEPPKIIVTQEVSELLLYDGEPRALPIKDTNYEYMANSAFAVVRDKTTGTCYLSGGKVWYSAKDAKGPWAPIDAPPADVVKLVPKDTSSTPKPEKPAKIVVATEPTELIASDGPPSW
ncbi:MAG: carbohydrate-binding family V/XII, partial [Candidatus Eisenbacteria bacterium]